MGMFRTASAHTYGQARTIPQAPAYGGARNLPGPQLPGPQMPRTMSGTPGPQPQPSGGSFSPGNLGGPPPTNPDGSVGGAPANLNENSAWGIGGGGMVGSKPVVHALGRMKGSSNPTGGGVYAPPPSPPQFQPAAQPPGFDPNDPNNAALAGYMSR